MESLPGYVSIVFILTTFLTIAFLVYALKAAGSESLPSKILLFVIPLWIFFQTAMALGGFYLDTEALPPRLFLFGPFPAFALILIYFLFFRKTFVEELPLRVLTLLHVVRIPVELVLYWLFIGGLVPRIMTFEGQNYDILSGILALIVYCAAFRFGQPRRWLLISFNIVGLLLLANIVITAIVSLPSPIQAAAFEQPNRAVLYFPYIWLPTIVVPIVLFSHLAALWQLFERPKASQPGI